MEGDGLPSGYITLAFSGAQKWAVLLCLLPRSPREEDKIRSGYITRAFYGGRKWAVLLPNDFVPGGPQVATSPIPSRGPVRGDYCYVTPAF